MAANSPEKELELAISRLRTERATLMARVSQIDESFGRLGIALGAAVAVPATPVKTGKRRGRPPGSKNSPSKKSSIVAKPAKPLKAAGKPGRKKGKRGKFAISGDESILAFVRSTGEPSTAEINAHWSKEGRKATANTPLSNLVKTGKLKRVEVEGERGSRYKIA